MKAKYTLCFGIIFLSVLFLLTGCLEQTETTSTAGENQVDEQTNPVNGSKVTATTATSGKEMKVHFIDVGQGDSIFIQLPNGKTILVDGGVKGAGKEVVNYIRSQGANQLSLVVATHPDADHIGGLIPVLNSIKINQFMDSGKVHTSQTYEDMLQLIVDKNIKYVIPTTGDSIELDKEVSIKVLSADENASDNNDASIVLKLIYGDVSVLLMADASIEMEKKMLATQDVKATILKAGHHGSNTSSSLAFLKGVNPAATVLSYGNDNKYGHPHAEVIDYLKSVHSKIYGTGESGTIVMTTNGIGYAIDKPEWTGVGATSSITWQVKEKQVEQVTPTQNTVYISEKDLEKEVVTITNGSNKSVSLQGWKLLSVQGNQTYNFPNISLKAGESIRITSGSDATVGNGYLKWTGRQIWLNDGDKAILYNAKGEVVSELD